jgi:predicted lipoprotein with Yx(FWY)xxD motif
LPSGLSASNFSTITIDGIKQLTYDGHPLYRYSGDSKSGDINGEGIGGVWYAFNISK